MAAAPIPVLDLTAEYAPIREEILAEIAKVFDSNAFVLGPVVEAFEREAAVYLQAEHAIGVSNGTDALLLALQALGVGPGDEVITSPFTFFASASVIARLGAQPVFADIDPVSFNIDPKAVGEAITPRTRAVVPVHLYGRCADMDAIKREAKDLPLVEDAAQAIGAEYNGRKAGTLGTLGCFSFYPTKNLGAAGEAGLVSTNVPGFAGKVRVLRHQGQAAPYRHEMLGGNYRMDAIQAAVLSVKLKHLDAYNDARKANADRYRRLFDDAGLAPDPVQLPDEGPHKHVYHQFVIRVPADRRDDLMAHLRERQIGCAIHYPMPLHMQPIFADLGYKRGDLPNSESIAERCLALPIFPALSDDQAQRVVEAIADFFKS
jgi:dTDP-4-amino-4,6-dideoxygalactose transaminase